MHSNRNSLIPVFLAEILLVASVFGQSVRPLVKPKALKAGDTIAIVAPAGPLSDDGLKVATQRLEKMGFNVLTRKDVLRKTGYLAGSDDQRLSEFMDAINNPEVDAVFPGRGGYGAGRILDRLDYDAIRRNRKIIIGFSDITALHIAIQQKAGLVTFHSPVPMWGLGSPEGLPDISAHWFWRALLRARYTSDQPGYLISATWPRSSPEKYEATCQLDPPSAMVGGKATGAITGGNLSLVAASMGTPYEIQTRDRILYLEDIGEAPYRVDRMLNTLRQAGKLASIKGVILGTFTRREEENREGEVTTMQQVLAEYFRPLGVPVLMNFPAGHHECNITLPFSVRTELDADAATVRLLENPVEW